MRNMSFMLTTEQIRGRSKTVTRRLGWKMLSAGMQVQACEKCMGLKPGQKINRLCVIAIVNVRREPLSRMIEDPRYGKQEARAEGFPHLTGEQFVEMFCKHMNCTPETEVTRIQFAYE